MGWFKFAVWTLGVTGHWEVQLSRCGPFHTSLVGVNHFHPRRTTPHHAGPCLSGWDNPSVEPLDQESSIIPGQSKGVIFEASRRLINAA